MSPIPLFIYFLANDPPCIRRTTVAQESGPRYEASLCGPTACLLVSKFPLFALHFMVKPEGKIRPEFINNTDDTTSLDSYHAEILTRGFQGSELGVLMFVEIEPSDWTLVWRIFWIS